MNPAYIIGALSAPKLAQSAQQTFTFDSAVQPGDWAIRAGAGSVVSEPGLGAVRYNYASLYDANYAHSTIMPMLTRPCTVEWDISMPIDSWGRRHFGAWLFCEAVGGLTGYRLCSLDGDWFIQPLDQVGNSSIGNPVASNGGLTAPTPILTIKAVLTPTIVHFYLNGVLLGSLADASFNNLLIGFMEYGCNIVCHEVRINPT